MNYQDEIHFKALTPVYGVDEILIETYQSFLKHEFGERWNQVYEEIDKRGFLQIRRVQETNIYGGVNSSAVAYLITGQGNIFYRSMLKSIQSEGTQKTYNKRILIIAIVTALAALYLIYLAYFPPKQSKDKDPAERPKVQSKIDSLNTAGTDTIYQDSGDEVHDPLPPEIKVKSDSVK